MVHGRTSRERAAAIEARWRTIFKEATAWRAPTAGGAINATAPQPGTIQAPHKTPDTHFEKMLRAAQQRK